MRSSNVVFVVIAFFGVVTDVEGQIDCAKAPTEGVRIYCEQIRKWNEKALEAEKRRDQLPPGFSLPSAPSFPHDIEQTLDDCVTLYCACNYLDGDFSKNTSACFLPMGRVLKKATRKEYRVMTDEERGRFHGVLNALREMQELKRLERFHADPSISAAAHGGPAFLPWHREFLKRLELMIRKQDPTLYLPYWDSTLDAALPKPADSVIFTDNFFGSTDENGNLVRGPFKEWTGYDNVSGTKFNAEDQRTRIFRKLGISGALMTTGEVESILAQTSVQKFLSFSAPQTSCLLRPNWNALEFTQANVLAFVAGDQLTLSNDPALYLHYSFVDLLWENWRQNKQDRIQASRNLDGLLSDYTDSLYEYAPRPTCPDCGGSSYLFCDSSRGTPRCVAKVRAGGSCLGFTGNRHVCYAGNCVEGTCVPSGEQIPSFTTYPIFATTTTTARAMDNCFNEDECCPIWAKNQECHTNALFMSLHCRVSCGFCTPQDYQYGENCDNYHTDCGKWAQRGDCVQNPWMLENCRSSCGSCLNATELHAHCARN